MTQEELDALMAGDLDEETLTDQEPQKEDAKFSSANEEESIDAKNYKVNAEGYWPPPPPTSDHQVVNQLDTVTKDSEKKASEIFDKLEGINEYILNSEENINLLVETIKNNINLFEKLTNNFTTIETFKKALQQNQDALQKAEEIISDLQMSSDEIMMIMDIMQYQDIHRQKIERVINVMRALTKYMNGLFESSVDDSKRVSSATHLEGDDTEDVVANDDIEALIAQFGK